MHINVIGFSIEMKRKKNSKVPGPVRIGISLLIFGAIVVGLGTVLNKDALSLYGFIIVVCGFFLYFASSIYLKKQEKNKIK
jgi:hypothetical protein